MLPRAMADTGNSDTAVGKASYFRAVRWAEKAAGVAGEALRC